MLSRGEGGSGNGKSEMLAVRGSVCVPEEKFVSPATNRTSH